MLKVKLEHPENSRSTVNMTGYARIAPSEEDTKNPSEITELPLEDDDTLLLSTVCATFANAIGLKYRHTSGSLRGLRLANERFSPPEEGWDGVSLFCVYAKDMKRKGDALEDEVAGKRIDTKCCDLIVLGLAFGATEKELTDYFLQFGNLAFVLIKRDPTNPERSKGFAFIRFEEYSAQQKVLSQRHNICRKWCDVKIPNSRLEKEGLEAPKMQFRIYVGGCGPDLTADDIREYFSQFGVVTEVYVPKPFKACAFVTFQEARVAKSLLDEEHVINGCTVHTGTADQVKRPNQANQSPVQQYQAQAQQKPQQQQTWARSPPYTFGGMSRATEATRGISGGAPGYGPPGRSPAPMYKPSGSYQTPSGSAYNADDSSPISNLPPAMFSAIASAVVSEVFHRGMLSSTSTGGDPSRSYDPERGTTSHWSDGGMSPGRPNYSSNSYGSASGAGGYGSREAGGGNNAERGQHSGRNY